MSVLGVRCSNSDFVFAILSGTRSAPNLEQVGGQKFPKGFSTSHRLKWLLQEAELLVQTKDLHAVVIKGTETMASKGNAFVERVEAEAIVFLAAANKGVKPVLRKVKSTIAKNLGFKGRGHYLQSLDTSPIPNFEGFSEKEKEAIWAAWSELRPHA